MPERAGIPLLKAHRCRRGGETYSKPIAVAGERPFPGIVFTGECFCAVSQHLYNVTTPVSVTTPSPLQPPSPPRIFAIECDSRTVPPAVAGGLETQQLPARYRRRY